MCDKTEKLLGSLISSSLTIVLLYGLRSFSMYVMKEESFQYFDITVFCIGVLVMFATLYVMFKYWELTQKRN